MATEIEKLLIADSEIMHPLTGELVSTDDVDGMAEMLVKVKAANERLYQCELSLRSALASKAQGDGKTLRVRGARYRLKVELPDDGWSNAIFKKLWQAYPDLAPTYLRIEKFAPQMREVKKLANEQGPERFEAFKSELLSANEGPKGTPRITIEEDGNGDI